MKHPCLNLQLVLKKERTKIVSPGLEWVLTGIPALRVAVRDARELIESHGVQFRMRYLRYAEGYGDIPLPVDALRNRRAKILPHGGVAILQIWVRRANLPPGKKLLAVTDALYCERSDLFCRAVAWQKAFQRLERSGDLAVIFELAHEPGVNCGACGSIS